MEPPGQSRIPTRNRRRTLDWGLVLLSQGIAATIDDGADGAGWALWVPTEEYPAALEAIRLYQTENRHWRWRQPGAWRGFRFDWKVSLWALLLVAVHLANRSWRPEFRLLGRMDNAAVRLGQWWRIFTAMLLHVDAAHLASNVVFGVIFLGLAMGRFGSGVGLLASYLAGAAGNVAGLLFYPAPHFGVGASGMVMGGLGLLAAQSIPRLRYAFLGRKQALQGLMAAVMLLVLFGLSPETDVLAHCAGFGAGLLLGTLWLHAPRRWQTGKTDTAAALLFAGLLVATGWRACR